MPPPPRLPPAHQGKTQAVPGTVRLFWASGHAAAVHHRPAGSAVNTVSEALQPPREDAMLGIPAFPCRKTLLPPREGAVVERDGIGLNLSALEQPDGGLLPAGYPVRPERRPSSAPPKKENGNGT